MSSVMTVSQSRHTSTIDEGSSDAKASMDSDVDPEALEVHIEFETQDTEDFDVKSKERTSSLAKLQGSTKSTDTGSLTPKDVSPGLSRRSLAAAEAIIRRNPKNGPDAVIVLKEEKVC